MKSILALSTVFVIALSYNAYGGQHLGSWHALAEDETTITTTTKTLCGTKQFDEQYWTSTHKCGSNLVDLLEDLEDRPWTELPEDVKKLLANKRCSDNVVPGQVIMTHPPIYNCQDLLDSQKIDDDAERKRIKAIVREVMRELKKIEKFKKEATKF